ncbi:MAG: hypothetical protein Q4F57_08950 [Weeksellaceae bacterium]|nr:hypothetical protein [Weeksellaceae bacterium]
MQSFWDKIKGMISRPKEEPEDEELDISYTEKVPTDEEFVKNFTNSGGHFFYCENKQELRKYLKEIVTNENIARFVCFDEKLQKFLGEINVAYQSHPSAIAEYSFVGCEGLIAFNGSIMLSSHNLGGRKITEMADNFVIFATTSQFHENSSGAMSHINRTRTGALPSGITSIGGRDSKPIENLPNSKYIYLLLLEE